MRELRKGRPSRVRAAAAKRPGEQKTTVAVGVGLVYLQGIEEYYKNEN